MRIAVVAHHAEPINGELVAAWQARCLDACLLTPKAAVAELAAGDVALFRLDVLPTLDGFEAGLGEVPDLRGAGVRILNSPWAILGAHDKLETARRLLAADLPHPRTVHVARADDEVEIEPPFVVKPRYGSWGRDIFRCATRAELRRCLHAVEQRSWFQRQGALVQELVPSPHRDLRVVVAGGRVVAASGREPATGEWRTNISLGGRLVAAVPDEEARTLALAAAAAVGGDLIGVDLLPGPSRGYTVLELNGAADFDSRYSLPGTDVYAEVAAALGFASRVGQTAHERRPAQARWWSRAYSAS